MRVFGCLRKNPLPQILGPCPQCGDSSPRIFAFLSVSVFRSTCVQHLPAKLAEYSSRDSSTTKSISLAAATAMLPLLLMAQTNKRQNSRRFCESISLFLLLKLNSKIPAHLFLGRFYCCYLQFYFLVHSVVHKKLFCLLALISYEEMTVL